MSTTASRFLPIPDPDSAAFWEACREHRLVAQRCGDCDELRFPPSPICDNCRSWSFTWSELPETGELYSWIVVHHHVVPDVSDLPYVVGLVTYGPRIRVPGLVHVDPAACRPGLRLRVTFRDASETVSIPEFVPE